MGQKSTIIIGIAGASASGKSLLASTIVNEIGSERVTVISEDAYYNDQSDIPFHIREQTNYDHPDAFDHELLKEHLQKLRHGESVEIPQYNYVTHTREEATRKVGGQSIVVLEGILLLTDKELRQLMDIRIYMDTPLDFCILRRIKRDVIGRGRSIESVIQQYEETVRPMYLQFIEPSKRYADVIVPRGGKNRIAIDLIKAKMRELLEE
ncbi:uridine kinase [Piscirickettsia salmonis]|uniref:Uridine kinase n=1 Tax=Piscirickettsia salmonis TaxID=1238 RepID=A0A9Q6LSJ1_PISSA|nr:uridine kinase [Piscirickettsia salmonis]ALA24923.1 uridine kinase [Piscirickettsia salmonis]APS45229.1 uridine kinase [Piscirickettsia salmonis]APS48590.1 uridine kinase [Piscirickettsia salmonis]APS49847.1 uridine kinase [Piscirickettsia salmonis]APS53033.1 uridine kinase [Piscirickettsia salmonis]